MTQPPDPALLAAMIEARQYAARLAAALLRAGFDLPTPPPPWLDI